MRYPATTGLRSRKLSSVASYLSRKRVRTVVAVEHLSKRIGRSMVLDDITLSMRGGCVYGLHGANGSGKTMLMRAICGLIRPTQGAVLVDDKVVGKQIPFPPSIGSLIENPAFLDGYTALENLRLLAQIRRVVSEEGIRQVLDDVGLDPNDRRSYRKFSLGMRQRLGIAAAVMESPKLIVLDEPTNGLAADGVLGLRSVLERHRDDGALIVVASHDRDELTRMSDELFKIDRARVVDHQVLKSRNAG